MLLQCEVHGGAYGLHGKCVRWAKQHKTAFGQRKRNISLHCCRVSPDHFGEIVDKSQKAYMAGFCVTMACRRDHPVEIVDYSA